MRAVHQQRVPVRGVGGKFRPAGAQRVHVLHREDDVGLLAHPRQPLGEVPGVVPLPAERRVYHDDLGAQCLRRLLGPDQLAPRLVAPHPLGHQQAGRMQRQHGHAVVGGQPLEGHGVLAHGVGGDHDLEAVIAEARRQLECVSHPFREDRGRGQRDQRPTGPGAQAQHCSFPPAPAWGTFAWLAYAPRRIRTCTRPAHAGVSDPATTVRAMGSSSAAQLYRCAECGWRATKWSGRCGGCQAWGTVEQAAVPAARTRLSARATDRLAPARAVPITQVDARAASARPTGLDELDRVLGGGLVPGAVVLLAGEPGVGKSTLLLEAGALVSRTGPVLYVAGEESAAQVRLRADRTGALGRNLYIAAETDLAAVLAHVEAVRPQLLIVDSVQTIVAPGVEGTPGGVTQIREVTSALMAVAKQQSLSTVLVGHVTKDGAIAGPRALEHLVDVVLHFEGDRHAQLRMVRALKNRFGPTDEVGCFELGEAGLAGLADPSGLFISQHGSHVPGTCLTVTLEGRRPLIAEVQTLVAPSAAPEIPPRRVTAGLDSARVAMVIAVLQRRADVKLGRQDVFAATVGGVRLAEPAVDLAIALALASAAAGLSVAGPVVAVGEVGLAGEVRRVPGVARRIAEAQRLGFRRAIVPAGWASERGGPEDTGGRGAEARAQTDVREVTSVREAIAAALGGG